MCVCSQTHLSSRLRPCPRAHKPWHRDCPVIGTKGTQEDRVRRVTGTLLPGFAPPPRSPPLLPLPTPTKCSVLTLGQGAPAPGVHAHTCAHTHLAMPLKAAHCPPHPGTRHTGTHRHQAHTHIHMLSQRHSPPHHRAQLTQGAYTRHTHTQPHTGPAGLGLVTQYRSLRSYELALLIQPATSCSPK